MKKPRKIKKHHKHGCVIMGIKVPDFVPLLLRIPELLNKSTMTKMYYKLYTKKENETIK